jgi:hypothetical protein
MNYHIEDFTEENYRRLIELAKSKYKFITYAEVKDYKNDVILLRHDVDFSIHRALKLAGIEAELNVFSTFFLYPHSTMYNLLEKEVSGIVREIIRLGHKIGLHFEPAYYDLEVSELPGFKKYLQIEKQLLMDMFDTDVDVFSFHNPDIGGWMAYEEYETCGMVNTYSRYIKDNYFYCSDSNGYWRYTRLEDLLSGEDLLNGDDLLSREDLLNGDERKLQILLHPEWWVPNASPPHDRIIRCIDGRSKKSLDMYEEALEKMERINVK